MPSCLFDLGLHCLPMFHKKGTRLIWVEVFTCNWGSLIDLFDLILYVPSTISQL